MIEVTKDQFFKAVGGPEDIHPTSMKDHSAWKNQRTYEQVGRSEPGYLSPYGTPHRYWLTEAYAARKGIAAP